MRIALAALGALSIGTAEAVVAIPERPTCDVCAQISQTNRSLARNWTQTKINSFAIAGTNVSLARNWTQTKANADDVIDLREDLADTNQSLGWNWLHTHNNTKAISQNTVTIDEVIGDVQQLDTRVTGLEGSVNRLQRDVRQLEGGVALGIATASHQFNVDRGPQASLGLGTYGGATAMSFALGTRVTDRVFVNVNAGTTSRGGTGFGAGLTFALQDPNAKDSTD